MQEWINSVFDVLVGEIYKVLFYDIYGFPLIVLTLLIGSITSLIYTLETNQKLFTAWAPYVWPIKIIMLFGILLMLLQSISMFFKDVAKIRKVKIN